MIGEAEKLNRRVADEPSIVKLARQLRRCRYFATAAFPTSDESFDPTGLEVCHSADDCSIFVGSKKAAERGVIRNLA